MSTIDAVFSSWKGLDKCSNISQNLGGPPHPVIVTIRGKKMTCGGGGGHLSNNINHNVLST